MTAVLLSSGKLWIYDEGCEIDPAVDVWRALAALPRFTGHRSPGVTPWSVAHHSIAMAMTIYRAGLGARLAQLALLHDAHEAIVGDIPTPYQEFLGEEFKRRHAAATRTADERIYAAYGIAPPDAEEAAIIKHWDRVALNVEFSILFGEDFGPKGEDEAKYAASLVDLVLKLAEQKATSVLLAATGHYTFTALGKCEADDVLGN